MINEKDFYDFGDPENRGDVIDLFARFNNVTNGEAIARLASDLGIRGEAPFVSNGYNRYLAVLEAATKYFEAHLDANALGYLSLRGVDEATAHKLRIGYAPPDTDNVVKHLLGLGYSENEVYDASVVLMHRRIVFPYIEAGKVKYMTGRTISNEEPKYTKLRRCAFTENPTWGSDTLIRPGTVIITEGIMDAIPAYLKDFPVLAMTGSRFSKAQRADIVVRLKGRRVAIVADHDPVSKAGEKFATELAAMLFNEGVYARLVFFPNPGPSKIDLNSYWVEKGNLEVLDKSVDYAEWQVRQIPANDQDALEMFLRDCARVMDVPRMKQLQAFIKALDVFDGAWLTALFRALMSAPSEDIIVKKLMQEHQLLYHEQLGWFKYSESYWRAITATEIETLITDLYGRHVSGRLIASSRRVAEARCQYHDSFNAYGNMLNFKNGMLNIETQQMHAHSSKYYSTIQIGYEYSAGTECPKWKQFLEDVTGGDKGRKDVLQEIAGYCLTRDNRYQKAFFLIGDGSNGKSMYLHTLERLVTPDNCAHVEMSDLDEPFQRIGLHGKLVNLATETKSDIAGVETVFKKIVAGDPITGCFKGRDFISFVPFCKMVFALNDMIVSRDVSHGFVRRMIFINFPMRFEYKPVKDNHRLRIDDIDLQFVAELPGIMNWALAGLRRLRQQKQFTETADQTEYVTDFVAVSNPLKMFVDDVIVGMVRTELPKSHLYEKYRMWCEANGCKPMSSRQFFPRLRKMVLCEDRWMKDERSLLIVSIS